MFRRLVVFAVLAACARFRSISAVPLFRCAECNQGGEGLIATHAPLDLWTSWQGECWEEQPSFGVSSDSGQHDAEHEACDFVDYHAKVACTGAACTITALPYREKPDRRFIVVPTSPGRLQIVATLAHDGEPQWLEQRFVVAKPDRVRAACTISTMRVLLVGADFALPSEVACR